YTPHAMQTSVELRAFAKNMRKNLSLSERLYGSVSPCYLLLLLPHLHLCLAPQLVGFNPMRPTPPPTATPIHLHLPHSSPHTSPHAGRHLPSEAEFYIALRSYS
ncbi:hypothetical protein Vafri_21785, partial [Volvox africanus]